MSRTMLIDCPTCNARHEWSVKDPDERCPRCRVMQGTDITAMLVEQRKNRVPGQEPVLRMIENLNERVKKLEAPTTATLVEALKL